MEEESPSSLSKEDLQKAGMKQKEEKTLRFSPSLHTRRDTLSRNCKMIKKRSRSPKNKP
ncbi:rCG62014 [Rattus norvegicus]|nr:rCG62014 [Rattus norvegicus]